MHDVLKKLFDKVIFYETDCIKVGRKLDEEVNTIIEPLWNGTKRLIKRRVLDEYLDKTYSI